MTRKQLRSLLDNVVKIKSEFIINVSGHDKGCIRLVFPESCTIKGQNPLMYNIQELSKNDSVLLRVKQTQARNHIRSCCKQLEENGFKVLEKTINNIEFQIPKKYVKSERKTYDYILGEMENAVPKRSICPY